MADQVKLLFDENIGFPMVISLKTLLALDSASVIVDHVIPRGFAGMNDDVWIPLIAKEGWIVISGDRGSRQKKSKGPKLPIVCWDFMVTHVILGRSINKGKSFEKIRTILSLWDEIVATSRAPRGSRFVIRPGSSGRPTLQTAAIRETARLDDTAEHETPLDLPITDPPNPG